MTTAANIIEGALRALRRLGINENPTNEAYSIGLATLNMMLDTFAARSLFIYATTQVSKTLTAGTNSYTIGSNADIDTTRPVKIVDALIRDGNNYDYYIKIISKGQYNSIVSKQTSSRPRYLWYKPEYPLGKIYLYPSPDAAETLVIDCVAPFSSFSSINTSVSFPPGYQEALKYNLAIRLAPEYGISASPEVVALATSGIRTLESLNGFYGIEPVVIDDMPGVSSGRYDIRTDDYY